jgi:ribosomal protein S18 acetylase RimI-like enzyme
MSLTILPCGNEHLEELIHFIIRLNDDAAHHIGYFGIGEEEVRASLDESTIATADGFRLAYENEKLVGAFGVDVNPEIGRAWLLGPIVEHANWQELADQLYSEVQSIIPQGITDWELFCDENNRHVHEFALRHGFPLRAETAIFSLGRDSYRPAKVDGLEITDFQNRFFEQFETLHNEIFPKTYFTAKQIVEKLGSERRLLTAVQDGQLLGYNFCKIESELGYIDFIGTAASARKQGVGSALLTSGINWMFSSPTVSKINLTVHAGNEPARALYKKFGFDIERITRGYRKTVNV